MPYLDERQLDDLSSSGFPYYNCHTCTTSSPHILASVGLGAVAALLQNKIKRLLAH